MLFRWLPHNIHCEAACVLSALSMIDQARYSKAHLLNLLLNLRELDTAACHYVQTRARQLRRRQRDGRRPEREHQQAPTSAALSAFCQFAS